jgi:hypothetical protein
METDDGKRGNSGVVCSLRDLGNGRVRLVLDDVSNPEFSTKGKWSHEVVFTWKDYDFSKIENQELSEKELADFGFNLLVRLGVLFKQPYK